LESYCLGSNPGPTIYSPYSLNKLLLCSYFLVYKMKIMKPAQNVVMKGNEMLCTKYLIQGLDHSKDLIQNCDCY
jgi:hypothetical protein